MTELTPKRSSFIYDRVTSAAIAGTILAIALVVLGNVIGFASLMLLGPALGIGLVAASVFMANVAWGKERYVIHDTRLVAHSGGITSDSTTELDVKNITHVKQHLSWIRYRFFDVGDVIVQSAGSSSAEVVFRSVREPDVVYDRIRALLKANGFSMQANELLHSEQPNTLGVVVECLSIGVGMAFFVMWAFAGMLAAVAEAGAVGLLFSTAALGLIGVGMVTYVILHFFDMKQRTYEVYDDVVEYREGFLSRTNAFIPAENIADASTKQTLFDQVLGLYDVTVSCQGSGSEVAFRRLANGPQLQRVLRGRLEAAQANREHKQQISREDKAKQVAEAEELGVGPTVDSSRPPAQLVPAAEAWTAEIRMNRVRAFLGGALFPALGTTYTVGPSSVASRYALIGQQQLEFAYDKVTGVQVRTSPLDGLFDTFTVRIWSIGSSTPLDLAHVDRRAVDLPALLRQAGIPGGEARCTLPAEFSVELWVRASVATMGLVAFLFLTTVVLSLLHWSFLLLGVMLVGAVGLSYPFQAIRSDRQLLTLHEHHIEHQSGVFWRRHIHARYDDVKKISTLRYAGSVAGAVTVYVAGETQLQAGGGKGAGAIPNLFTAHFLPDVTPFSQTFDRLLKGEIEPEQVTTSAFGEVAGPEFRPAAANSVVVAAIVGIFFPPLWLMIPWVVYAVRHRRYRVEEDRAVIEAGVFYLSHTSVLFDRIDSLEEGQAMLGKAFGNGTVTLYTAGSSRPDLVMSNSPGFHELYLAIRERYGGR